MVYYNDDLSPEDQIDTEEAIAATIFDADDCEISEGEAAELGRKILALVLKKFRPDLIDDSEEE